jgi:prepilin-type N-terminal cleavage/methylation domain-containing protein
MGFMTKNRNKGFSLIEVIIGVAVLTILLTPVVKQLAQTMQTNRLAKEQQYANESATNVLEYAQKTSFSDLKTVKTSSTDSVYVTNVSDTIDRTCTVYIYDSADGSIKPVGDYAASKSNGDTNLDITYGVTTYNMNNVTLGSRRTEYTRTLILDNLTNKLSEVEYNSSIGTDTFGLRVYYYESTDPTAVKADISGSSMSGFEYTSEGSIVQYATDSDGTYINGIVCVKKDSSQTVSDPNAAMLGSMHDLISTQTALVNGDITNFDSQAESDLYAAAMAYLKEYNPTRYDQLLGSQTDVNVLQDQGYTNNLKKSVTVSITQDKSGSKPYYLIKVNVHYTSIPDTSDRTRDVELDYNVFSQKFYYTDTGDDDTNPSAPSIYMEYQPFTINGVNYSANEYFYIENHVDNATIYLYQPAKDYNYATALDEAGETVDVTKAEKASGSYKVNSSGSNVKIHINKIDAAGTSGKRTNIYTNLVKTDTDEDTGDSVSYVDYTDPDSQFDVSEISSADSIYETGYSAFESINPINYDSSKTTLYLKRIQDDYTTNDRLYTATVIVEPVTASVNTITLTGAKGGQ